MGASRALLRIWGRVGEEPGDEAETREIVCGLTVLHGPARGPEISPLHHSAPATAQSDQKLYDYLSLVDALRTGRARERKACSRSSRQDDGFGLIRQPLEFVAGATEQVRAFAVEFSGHPEGVGEGGEETTDTA